MAQSFHHPSATSTLPADESCAVVFLRHLAARGVRVAFGIPGGTISPFFEALRSVPEIEYVATRHEAIAAFAATGYARATGLPALVLTTSGPGLTNAITGIAAARLEEVPMIVVSGEVPTRAIGRGTIQDGTPAGLHLHAMLQSITRWCGTLDAAGAAGVAERAWQASMTDACGPVFVSAPLDAAARTSRAMGFTAPRAATPAPDAGACRSVGAMLERARRPFLLLGNGARGAAAEALALAERLQIPTAVTGHAKGTFPERHPLYLGIVGLGQHPSVTDYLETQPDVTLVVGSRLNDITTNGWSLRLAGTQATVQVDRDPLLVGRNLDVSHALVGDAAATLAAIARALTTDVARPARRADGCRSHRAELAFSNTSPLKPQRVLQAFEATFPDAIWCCDIGEHASHALHYLRVDSPERFHVMLGLGSMGSGFGAAIGVARAHAGRTVLGLVGDGGFLMHLGEVLACVEHDLRPRWIVFNDGRWNMVDHGFRAVYGGVPTRLPSRVADLADAARALGAHAVVVEGPNDLAPERLRAAAEHPGPVVFDVRIDPTEALTQDTRSASLKHFKASQH